MKTSMRVWRRGSCSRPGTLVLIAMLAASGCAAPGRTVVAEPEPEPDPVAEPVDVAAIDHSAYEDFDPSPYRDEPAIPEPLEHDVPAQLLAGRAGAGTVRVGEGYRIQLFQTQDRMRAEEAVERIVTWWLEEQERGNRSDLFSRSQPPVYNVWRQPYYRVRVGDFASRSQAERALAEVKSRFDGAFVVPDRVNLVR